MINPKPEHKFFDKFLDNNLEELFNYLYGKAEDLLAGKIGNIPAEKLSSFNIYNGAPTQLGDYYNIFTWDHSAIQKLKNALGEVMREASEYYGIDYESENYFINGWFNLDFKTEGVGAGVSPLDRKSVV